MSIPGLLPAGQRASRAPKLSEHILDAQSFVSAIRLEQLRSERDPRRSALMLVESPTLFRPGRADQSLEKVLHALSNVTRVTDVIGWYRGGSAIGVIFTEIASDASDSVANMLRKRAADALDVFLPDEQLVQISNTLTFLEPGSDAWVAVPDGFPEVDDVLSEESFLKTLRLERKRTERSHRSFVLVLLESAAPAPWSQPEVLRLVQVLRSVVRNVDSIGWYVAGRTLGVIFTEGPRDRDALPDRAFVARLCVSKVEAALCGGALELDEITGIRLSAHSFPTDSGEDFEVLYPDVMYDRQTRQFSRLIKRLMDIGGSILALIFSVPFMAAIAIGIKLTQSQGPILFRQLRVGQFGKPFTYVKFRTMFSADVNPSIHEEFVKRFISGNVAGKERDTPLVYKLARDPRITPFGRFLRNKSLDELPQFWSVLRGDMSLVGPRPPVQYEFDSYLPWHKNQVFAIKPGITGLWVVSGRSRVTFDEMVRLDLRYVEHWSLWLDLKILLRTPLAVLSDLGAY